jgi:hypothetical protein
MPPFGAKSVTPEQTWFGDKSFPSTGSALP